MLRLNPLSGIIEGFRDSIFNRPFHWRALGFSAVVTIVLLVCAAYGFRRMEREFADVI
jgi:ABC-type polysaccharide/polyol phosphate export permease